MHMNMKLMALVALPLLARAEAALDPVAYLDWDATTKTFVAKECSSYTVVTAGMSELANGWFVVKGDISRGQLKIKGNVSLILTDGSNLAAKGAGYKMEAGVRVGEADSLTIYGQEEGTGHLHATSPSWGAGIGGDSGESCGMVTINGGTVTTDGSYFGAGIGGGMGEYATGVSCGVITINGGTVTANSEWGAGIGVGYDGSGGSVRINGGRITTNRIGLSRAEGYYYVDAVVVTGGLFAKKVGEPYCIEHYGFMPNLDSKTSEVYPWEVRRKEYVVTTGVIAHKTGVWRSADGKETMSIDGTSFILPAGAVGTLTFTAESGYTLEGTTTFDLGPMTQDLDITADLPRAHKTRKMFPVSYVDETGALRVNQSYDLVTSATTELAGDGCEDNGWYVVNGTVTCGALEVRGKVNLILMDGASLFVKAEGDFNPAINVKTGNSFSVYGQVAGTGFLSAEPGEDGSAIAPRYNYPCGDIAIHGGVIEAKDDRRGYGYGIGESKKGGTLTITGGRVMRTTISGHFDRTTISAGLFGMKIEESQLAENCRCVDNTDPETSATYPYVVLPPAKVRIESCPYLSVKWTSEDGSVLHTVEDWEFRVPVGTTNVKLFFEPVVEGACLVGPSELDLGTVTEDVVVSEKDMPKAAYVYRVWDADRQEMSERFCTDFEFVTSTTATLADNRWYVVRETVVCGTITVSGAANLVLCDGAALIAQSGAPNDPGVCLTSGNVLTVYGQKDQTGTLVASGGQYGAGIGGGRSQGCGAVQICGGSVTTTGGAGAAGIGAGAGSGEHGTLKLTEALPWSVLVPAAPQQHVTGMTLVTVEEYCASRQSVVFISLRLPTIRSAGFALQDGARVFAVRFEALPGRSYVLKRSDDLTTDASEWEMVGEGTATDEMLVLIDAEPPPVQAFYRVEIQ